MIREKLESTSMSLMKKVSSQDESDSDNEENSNAITSKTYTSKDGTVWTKIDIESSASGRLPVRNIFSKSPGIKPFAKSKIDSESSAWRLLFTPKMVKLILDCTIEKGREMIKTFH